MYKTLTCGSCFLHFPHVLKKRSKLQTKEKEEKEKELPRGKKKEVPKGQEEVPTERDKVPNREE